MPVTSGATFGRLVVLNRHGGKHWNCRCECGNEKPVRTEKLLNGSTKSCGCLKRENTIHGDWRAKLYKVWQQMRHRCCNPEHAAWKDYGGRGIRVCPEWRYYIVFREWALTHGYGDGLEIDRENNDLGYSPENCRWIPHIDNSNNRRSSHFIEIFGESKTISQWAADERCRTTRSVFNHRLMKGWNPELALMQAAA